MGVDLGEMLAVSPEDMLRALSLRDREEAGLGDILLARGWVSEPDLMAALCLCWGAPAADLANGASDPRLVDRLGAEFCLRHGVVPLRRTGGATVLATCRPEGWAAMKAALPEDAGPVVMTLALERDIHAALIGQRQTALARKAETRTPAEASCRSRAALPAQRLAIGLVGLAVAGFVLAPVAMLALLCLWALVTVVAGAGLKLAAFLSIALGQGARTAPLKGTAGRRLPMVSVMVPLLREGDIAPRLVRRLGRIDYPRELLDILLVVEEDDETTLGALAAQPLPRWMRVVTVPGGPLRTKPRALNYALEFCRGSIVGVWDAEDAPEPGQIRKIVHRFQRAAPDVACLQGVLDFYNARHNWLSRCFAVEYAVWFRAVLPGLARLGFVVPLGGTTLFFRRAILEEIGAWDAHNVTEDADLGLRLARRGYRTELVDTVTEEEPNARVLPWIRQRARWQKGYAVTWATHMRDPRRLWRELGPRGFLGVQVLFPGALSQAILAPVLWSFWLTFFGLPHPVADRLPALALAALGALFVLSETVNVTVGLWAVGRSGHRHLLKWVPTLHFYFPLAALSCYRALVEWVLKPFYWDKTSHGHVGPARVAPQPLPVLILADPELPAARTILPLAAPRPENRIMALPTRLHLSCAAGWHEDADADEADPPAAAAPRPEPPRPEPPRLRLVVPYVLGSAIANAPKVAGIEFQPRFEGF
ncbi:MAG: glycosyltransferase [Rhodobacteraceae bacterium]|nr:glycosyltransferase [Paracoccaceae bacterium]